MLSPLASLTVDAGCDGLGDTAELEVGFIFGTMLCFELGNNFFMPSDTEACSLVGADVLTAASEVVGDMAEVLVGDAGVLPGEEIGFVIG